MGEEEIHHSVFGMYADGVTLAQDPVGCTPATEPGKDENGREEPPNATSDGEVRGIIGEGDMGGQSVEPDQDADDRTS